LAGPAPTFEAWGTTIINKFARSGNVATYTVQNTIVGPPQTITITGLSDSSFNGTFTILSMDNFNNFTAANTGANVSPTAGSGVGKLTSPAVTVTPSGILNGSTRYDYKVVMRDANGALSAASPAGTTTVGAATLGNNTLNVNSCSRTSGVVTCTTAVTHNLQVGTMVTLSGTSNGGSYDGQHVVASTPTGTTLTYSTFGQPDDAQPPSGGQIIIPATNIIQWNMQQNKQMQALIYRSINSGAYSLIGITEGMDGAFVDWNIQSLPGGRYVAAQASYISTRTPTASAVNGILASRITGISGTTVTIAANAVATATSQPAAHDNSPVVIAGCAALGTYGSGTLYIPNGGDVVFNSPLNLQANCTFPNPNKLKILVASSRLVVNEPIILRKIGTSIESVSGGGAMQSISTGTTSEVIGNAYPFFYIPTGNGPTTFKNFLMSSYNGYQSGVVEDQTATGVGTVNTDYDNVYFNGLSGSMPMILRGGAFFHRFKRGGFATGNGFGAVPEALLITIPHALGTASAGYILGGDMVFDQCVFIGKGALYETWGISGQSVGYTTYTDNLFESGSSPLIRFDLGGGANVAGINVVNPSYSDAFSQSTPMIELGTPNTGTVAYSAIRVFNPQCQGPLFASSGGDIEIAGSCAVIGASQYVQKGYGGTSTTIYNNASVGTNGGSFYTQMARPTAPVSLVASTTGGNIANGPHWYSIVAVDALNNPTIPSPQVFVATTGTNQSTVTLTLPTLPAGAVGYRVYRYDSANYGNGFYGVLDVCAQLTTPITGVFYDTTAAPCGNSAPTSNRAGTTILNSNGFYGLSITILKTPFANLGTPVNGTFYYCNDCTLANPCAGGGTGALAKRLNGIWVCN
jgi:hypothetical protein